MFDAVIRYREPIDARGYVCSLVPGIKITIPNGRDYMYSLLCKNPKLFKETEFIIGFVWKSKRREVAKLFGKTLRDRKWPGTMTMDRYVFKDGIHQPEENIILPEDARKVLSLEWDYRQRTGSLEKYMKKPPDNLGELEPYLRLTKFSTSEH